MMAAFRTMVMVGSCPTTPISDVPLLIPEIIRATTIKLLEISEDIKQSSSCQITPIVTRKGLLMILRNWCIKKEQRDR